MRAHATAAVNLQPKAARAILKLAFDAETRARMHEVAAKAQHGPLAETEQAELDSYRRVGRFLELMHSKARQSLKMARSR